MSETPDLIESNDETDAFVSELMRVMHDGEAELPREWVLSATAKEVQEARQAGRLWTFSGRGRFLRLMAPEQKPLLNELVASLVCLRVCTRPLHRGY